MVADFNGDGRSDLLNWDDYYSDVIYIKPDGKERLMDKMADGFNTVTNFDYKNLTEDPAFYARTISLDDPANAYPFNYIQQPLYAVSTVYVPNGIGGTSTTNYTYQDAILHRAGKGFLGFKNVTATNISNNIVSVSQSGLNTQYAMLVPSLSTSSLQSNGNNISSTQLFTSFQNLGTGIQKRFSTHVDKTVSKDYINKRASESSNTYDNYGNITSNTNKAGDITNYSSGPIQTTVTNTTYGIHNTPVPAKPENITVTQTRSGSPSLNNTTAFTYNALGQLQTKTVFSGLPKAVTTTYAYDVFGNVLTVTPNAAGVIRGETKFTYDNTGRFVIMKELMPSNSSYRQVETYTINTSWGSPLSTTSTDCLTTSFQYDGFGRIIKTTTPQGWDKNYSYNWDVTGNNIFYELVTDPYNPDTKTWHDLLGRKTKIQVKGFNAQWMTQLTTYDNQGRTATGTNNFYSTETPLTTTYAYDSYDRLSSTSNTLGTTQYSYSSTSGGLLTTTVTHADGNITSNKTDAAGITISTTDNGGSLGFTYDSRGNQTQVKHGNTVLVTSAYDTYGMQTSLTDIDGGTTGYDYDPWGNLTAQWDGHNNNYTLYYDPLNRLSTKYGSEGNSYYNYYKDANTGCSNNNITSIVSFSGIFKTFTYDSYHRLQTEVTPIDGVNYTTQYAYNNGNQLIKTTYPSGVIINNTYDNEGNQLTASIQNGAVLFTANGMNGSGEYTSYTLGNGKQSQNTYNYGIPTRLYTPNVQDLNLIFDYTTGNLTSRKDVIKNLFEKFYYDNLNRLTSTEMYGTTQSSFNYDNNSGKSFGNIITKSDAGNYIYDNQKVHQVKFIANATDNTLPPPNISTNTQNINYAIGFQKTQTITEGNYQLDYTYGADYNRVKSVLKQNGSVTETKYYLGDYEKQVKAGVTKEIHYVAAGNGLCAIIVKQGGTNTVYYAYTDHLGSILTLTNASGGAIAAEQSFDAWGRYRNPSTWKYTNIPALPDWLYRGYTGHEHVPQFALINMNGRMYDPVNARMLSVDNYVSDPFNTQAYNRYGYALNNPLVYTDPNGEFLWLLIPVIIGAVVNVADNWGNIQDAFHQGFLNGIGKTLGYSAVGGLQGLTTFELAPVSPILSNVVSNVIGSVGNGLISGESAQDIITNTATGIGIGIATGGLSQATDGLFNKAGDFASKKVGNIISSKIIANTIGSFVSNFASNLTTNAAIDALDGDGFQFGKDLGNSAKNAAINSAIDGASDWAQELKQRQINKQTESYQTIKNNQIVNTQEGLPEYGMVNKTLTGNPMIQYSSTLPNPQLQRNLNMINRLKIRSSTIIRDNEGGVFKIIMH